MKKCSRCKGKGMRETKSDIVTCHVCKGTGQVKDAREVNAELAKKRDAEYAAAKTNQDLVKSLMAQQAKKVEKKVEKKVAPTPPPPKKDPCKHKVLHFENGGLHIVCNDCKKAWAAVNETRLTFDFSARAEGLSDQDVRKNPFL